jgi:hypothetical protein
VDYDVDYNEVRTEGAPEVFLPGASLMDFDHAKREYHENSMAQVANSGCCRRHGFKLL